MSETKCPFCQRKLKTFSKYTDGTSTLYCSKCNLIGDSKLFSELIHTRKALDVALDGLTTIGGYLDYNDCVGIALDTKDKIYKILEQKDVK